MPAAKKSTNSKQKQSLISKLKLNTLKGRILTTVLVFAVIGGGFAVYKSFAATPYRSFVYDVARGTMIKGGAGATYYSESSKSNKTVVKLTKKNDYVKIFDNTYGITIPTNQIFDFCITAKPELKETYAILYNDTTDNYPIVAGTWNAVESFSSGYVKSCMTGGSGMRYGFTAKGPFYYKLNQNPLTTRYIESIELRFY